MSPPLQLPASIKTILVTGAGGFVGQRLTAALLAVSSSTRIITTDLHAPTGFTGESRVVAISADLGKTADIEGLFAGNEIDCIFALHGIMSGGSEANMSLGYAVNVDSHLSLLKQASAHKKGIVYVYISGLAVYGGKPTDVVDPEITPLRPETSYGVEKAIAELYVFDYTRKGLVDGRIIRLPTVAIRAGAPSTAASSFISGVIREPLQGLPSELPIASGPEDPAMDELLVYLSRTKTVIRNIIYAACIPANIFPKNSRSVNLPGITVSPRQILAALEKVGGKRALDLVTYKKDEKVCAICESWPGGFKNDIAIGYGFEQDNTETGFADAVQDFYEETLKVEK